MVNIFIQVSKYIMIVEFALYTFLCFSALRTKTEKKRDRINVSQRTMIFIIQFLGFLNVLIYTGEAKSILFFAVEEALFVFLICTYGLFYKNAPKIVLNNLCMLLSIGLLFLQRLDESLAVRQLIFAIIASVVTMGIPWLMKKVTIWDHFAWLYAIVGIAALGAVAVAGAVSYGAKLSLSVGDLSLQTSEFVKIIFVFYLASVLYKSTSFQTVVRVSIVAAAHVLILVGTKDLGAALIFFMVYLIMLYVSTQKIRYLFAGIFVGAVGSVAAYFLFSHVRTRVIAWLDPFSVIDDAGYQIAQSLFAIGSGGWFGSGLFMGYPESIPVVEEDFIFSAIAEELGCFFAICLILICVSCFFMFLNIAMRFRTRFYKLISLGLGVVYVVQVFLMIGGVTKFIPSTGVTLPLVSYGGSSLLATFILFSIILGLYIFKEREDEYIAKEERKQGRKEKQ